MRFLRWTWLLPVALVALLPRCSDSEATAADPLGGGVAGDDSMSGTGGSAVGGMAGSSLGGMAGTDPTTPCAEQLLDLEQRLAEAIDAAAEDTTLTDDPNLTLLLEADDGRTFIHAHGESTPGTSYESASTSKLVTAVVLLDLVAQGDLSLESRPQDLLDFWNADSGVTLRHLLSFTSGFHLEPCANEQPSCLLSCVNLPNANFAECVQSIYERNVDASPPAPGTEYYYSSTHLQIAGLMATETTGQTWHDIFDAWKERTELFPDGIYDLPSEENPRLAGGMHWTAEDYFAFLRALYRGELLPTELHAELFQNQRGNASVGNSPALDALDEDWGYAFGNWVECPEAENSDSSDCDDTRRFSSPGAYGAYPFLDFEHGYFGLLARQGTVRSFREGIAVWRAVEDFAEEWADFTCEP